MTNTLPWLSHGPNRNRCFTELKNGWIFHGKLLVITRWYCICSIGFVASHRNWSVRVVAIGLRGSGLNVRGGLLMASACPLGGISTVQGRVWWTNEFWCWTISSMDCFKGTSTGTLCIWWGFRWRCSLQPIQSYLPKCGLPPNHPI